MEPANIFLEENANEKLGVTGGDTVVHFCIPGLNGNDMEP